MTKNSKSKYRILGLVGRGQFGKVYCARDRQTNKLVAFKELEQSRFSTSKFLRELNFLISLNHPNVVSCISLEYNQNRRYLVMEYCEAGTLRSLIENNSLADQKSEPFKNLNQHLNLIIEILSGLKYAHDLNIIHCDLKPENILLKLTATGWQPKISDFGIARLGNDKSDNIGTPGYMAPERFYGQFSVASDLYAIGIILYELLIKTRPFSGTPTELMFAHLNQRLKIPDQVPELLKTFLSKALEKLPARRFSSAAEMQEQLKFIMNSEILSNFLDDELSFSNCLDISPNNLKYHVPILETNLSDSIITFGYFNDQNNDQKNNQNFYTNNLNFYTASEYLLEKRSLFAISNPLNCHKFNQNFNEKIIDLVITKNREYVITNRSIYIRDDIKNHNNFETLYLSDREFYWVVSDQWFVILDQQDSGKFSLKIKYLSNSFFPKILQFSEISSQAQIVALLKISNNHLALIANDIFKSNDIFIISRRGNLIAKFDLPMPIIKAIASYKTDKILLVTELNYLLIVDWKPYRINRIEIDYIPQIVIATDWGYVLSSSDKADSKLDFLDAEGNHVGNFNLSGFVVAITCINTHFLVISLEVPSLDFAVDSNHKILIYDLKLLDLDLLF